MKQANELDEVLVSGTQLNRLFKEMIAAEDKFFARFNELNPIDDFDTYCFRETHAGTKLKSRHCRAVFESEAYLKEGQDYVQFLQKNFKADINPSSTPQSNDPPTLLGAAPDPAHVAIQMRREAYRKNMLEVVAQYPELQELAKQRYEMGQRYEAARQKQFGKKSTEPQPEPKN